MSEDSDIAGHGAIHIIKNFKKSGECNVINPKTISALKNKLKNPQN